MSQEWLIKREYSQNTTCVENIVYSAIETTCFGLYWPSSGFYNIKEESIKAVTTLRECLLRDFYISFNCSIYHLFHTSCV
jgi:hypothetical protein